MVTDWLARLPPRWRANLVRLGFNLHPAFRGTGGRVVHVSTALDYIRIRLPLSWRTKNIVGSIYGGSLFAITDGAHPLMLMAALGRDVIVWDKSATIRYRKPGHATLYAEFRIDHDEVTAIRAALQQNPELDRTYQIEIKDSDGTVYAVVERTVYVANKYHYKSKIQNHPHTRRQADER